MMQQIVHYWVVAHGVILKWVACSRNCQSIGPFSMCGPAFYHVHPHSIGETRFFICEKLIFGKKKVGVTTYFIFILKGK